MGGPLKRVGGGIIFPGTRGLKFCLRGGIGVVGGGGVRLFILS